MNRRLLMISIIGALVLMPALADADDLEDLQATFEKFVGARNSMDIEQFLATIHDKWAGAGSGSIFIWDGGKTAMREAMLQN